MSNKRERGGLLNDIFCGLFPKYKFYDNDDQSPLIKNAKENEIKNLDIPFLNLHLDILKYLFHFLSLEDINNFRRTCKKINVLARDYHSRLQTTFNFTPSTEYDLEEDNKIAIRKKMICDGNLTMNGLWRPIFGNKYFTHGTYKWKLRVALDRSDGNDWKVCVGIASSLDQAHPEPLYDRWFGSQCNAFGVIVPNARKVSGTIKKGTSEGVRNEKIYVNNVCTVEIILNVSTYIVVKLYIDGKYCHNFTIDNEDKEKLFPDGKVWPIISCSQGRHKIEVI